MHQTIWSLSYSQWSFLKNQWSKNTQLSEILAGPPKISNIFIAYIKKEIHVSQILFVGLLVWKVFMVPTDHDIPFSRSFKKFWGTFSSCSWSFQGLFFVLSNIHSRKNDRQWTFQIRHTETIWSWVRQKNGWGGGGKLGMCFNFFRWIAALWL